MLAANLTRNISYLSLSQLANYAFPLVVIPYVTRTLGPSSYALTEFAGVIMVYFVSVVEFGFFTSATRKVAQVKDDKHELSEVFSAVLSAKVLIMLSALLLLAILVTAVPKFTENASLIWLSAPIILGTSLNTDFLFLGLQRAGLIALVNMLTKGLATVSIFLFIKGPEDYLWLNFINASATIGLGFILLRLAFKRVEGLRWLGFKRTIIFKVIWEARYIFLSNFSTRVYGFVSVPMGGFLMTPQQLGLFAAASKLINVGQNVLFQPLHGALFPHLASLIKRDNQAYYRKHRQALLGLSLVVALIVLALIFLAPYLVPLIFGEDYSEAIIYLQFMAPIWFMGVFAHLYLQQGLLVQGRDQRYLIVVLSTGLISILANYILINNFQAQGAVYARVLTEAVLALLALMAFYQPSKKL